VRQGLHRIIVQRVLGDGTEVKVLGIQPEFERLIEQAIGTAPVAVDGVIEPSLMRLLVQEVASGVDAMEAKNLPLVIVSSGKTRLTLSRIVKKVRSQASVLALSELPLHIHLSFERMLCSQAAQS